MFMAMLGQDPTTAAKVFLIGPLVAIFALFLIIWIIRNSKEGESGFKLRESDRIKNSSIRSDQKSKDQAARAPLQLPGIRIHGKSHEILEIRADATESEILKAYRSLMKIYHPDKIGPMGTREWQDAQKIAEAINRAKADMLKSLQENASKRSGR